MTHIALIYGPGPTGRQTVGWEERVVGVRFVAGSEDAVRANVINYLADEGDVFVRNLANTPLADLGSIMDQRIPPTIEEFDAAYPGCEFPLEFLTPVG